MAEETNVAERDEQSSGNRDKPRAMMALVITAVVVAASAAGGFVASRMSGGPAAVQAASVEDPEERELPPTLPGDEFVYHECEAITVNPDEPRRGRYINAAITLAIRKDDFKNVEKLIKARWPEIKSELIGYFAGCTLDDLGGSKNLNRHLRQIEERVNGRLWPGGRGLVHHALFKDFYIQ